MVDFSGKRFSDRALRLVRGRRDFMVRRRISDTQIFSMVCAMFVIAIGVGFIVLNDLMTISEKAIVAAPAFLLVIVSISMLGLKYKNLQDIVQATEFLNAAFISGLSKDYKFVMLVLRDSEIIYVDRGFQTMFPQLLELVEWDLSELFSLYHVPEEQRQKVMQALSKEESLVMDISIEAGVDKSTQTIQFSMDPLARPGGITLIRGK